jgi:UDP-N-acetyl-D-glucosamine dehydrogenase
MNIKNKSVCIIGLGYVGLPLAVQVISKGFSVLGIDINVELVSSLKAGKSHIEDVSSTELSEAIERDQLKISSDFSDLSDCDVVIICVPTPLTVSGVPDFVPLNEAVNNISKFISPGSLVSLESTVQPGGTLKLVIEPVVRLSGIDRESLHFCFSPERIDPGNKLWTLEDVPKIVAGDGEVDMEIASSFYESIFPNVVKTSNTIEAELAKLLENSFRLVNISFINEFALFCNVIGVEVNKVVELAKSKPFGFMPFRPGPGVGGHCIPVDPVYLNHVVREFNMKLKILDESIEVNQRLISRTVERIVELIKETTIGDVRVGVVGIAYKPDVADIRESPGIRIIEKCREKGFKVLWNDSLANSWNNENSKSLNELIDSCDLIVVSNIHSGFDLSPLEAQSRVPVLDLTYSLKVNDFIYRI